MAGKFTYDGNPLKNPRNFTRWLAGDTDKRNPLQGDKEIDAAIKTAGGADASPPDEQPVLFLAGAIVCERIAATFRRKANFAVANVRKDLGAVADNFMKQSKELRCRYNEGILPFFGGQTISGKESLRENPDAVQPAFRIGQTDDPAEVQINEFGEINRNLLGGQ